MEFGWSERQVAWRQEVRDFLTDNVTDSLRASLAGYGADAITDELRTFRRTVGAKGWRSLDWPARYGGLGRSRTDVEILTQEFEYAGVAEDDVTVTSVAPMILRAGSERNKTDWLPGIRSGDITVALGYSEPDAGTDLANMRCAAVLAGDHWVVNGTKLWNSGAHVASHEWLSVRTDQDARAHRGISVLMVPLDLPGITVQPIHTWGDIRTNTTFFDDVRVPAGNLIGEAGQGWRYITGALHLERAAIAGIGHLRRDLERMIGTLDEPGRTVDRTDSARVAELWARFAAIELLAWVVADRVDAGAVPAVEAAELKISTSEFRQELADTALQLFGPAGQLRTADGGAPAGGAFERLYRESPLLRFGGGTNEVLRDLVAQLGCGLPSSRRRTS